jgi:hypothetical protein
VIVFFGQFLKNREVALMFGTPFSTVKILTKNELGHVLGDFFTNLSGHPVFDCDSQTKGRKISSLEGEDFGEALIRRRPLKPFQNLPSILFHLGPILQIRFHFQN